MKYVEALYEYDEEGTSLFLAGGITNCPDWQRQMVAMLHGQDMVLLNPRRSYFPIGDTGAAYEQILWENRHLRRASAISFWFPKETLCPIVLYELGAWSMTIRPIFVGVHPDYERRQDVEIQTEIARADVQVVYSLRNLAEQVSDWVRG